MSYQQIETSQISTSRTVPITGFRSSGNGPTHEVHGTRIAPRWSDLPLVIRRERVIGGKHDLGISFADFRQRRATNDNARWIFALGLDFDALNDEQFQRALNAVAPYARVGWATWSFLSGAKPGWSFRIVLILKTPRSRDEWPEFWPAAVAHLGIADLVDQSCKNASRLFYMTCPGGHENDFDSSVDTFSGSGEEFDVPGFVASFERPTSDVAIPMLNDVPFVESHEGLAPCPAGTAPLDWARHLAATMPASISGNGGHPSAFKVARALVHGLEIPPADAFTIMSDLFNPRCEPPWSDRELEHKIADAVKPEGAPYARGGLLPSPAAFAAPSLDTLTRLAHRAWTDVGNAERLCTLHGETIRYCHAMRSWLTWDGSRWSWDERLGIVQIAKDTAHRIWEEKRFRSSDDAGAVTKHAVQSQGENRINSMISLARSNVAIAVGDLDADPWSFNVQNGTIDLRTGALRPHDRADMITKIAPVMYDPNARSPLWDSFISTVTGGDSELVAYLQRAIGCALVGESLEKAFWLIYGPPDGGKSTFVEAIAGALGDYWTASDADTWLARSIVGGNRGDLVRLLGRRLVTVTEIKRGAVFDEKEIKRATGGDVIVAAAKYQAEVEFKPTFSLWFAANDAPRIRDDDAGMWSRARRVPFVHSIPKERQDPALRRTLATADVRAAILAWAVRGCLEWQSRGLGTCAAVERSSDAYRVENDPIARFLGERCAFEAGAEVSRSALRMVYEQWATDEGIRTPASPREFANRVREAGAAERKSHGERGWTGIRVIHD